MLAQTYIHTHNNSKPETPQNPRLNPKSKTHSNNHLEPQTQNLKLNQETKNSHTQELRRRERLGFGHGLNLEREAHQ